MRGGYSSLYSARIRSPSLPVKSCGVRMKNMSPPPAACRSCSRIYKRLYIQYTSTLKWQHLKTTYLSLHSQCNSAWGHTLAFFFMCLSRGWAGCGPGWATAPNEYFFRVGRWNWRSFMGPMWVGKKGCRSSRAGMECCQQDKKFSYYTTQFVLSFIFTVINYHLPEWCCHRRFPSGLAVWGNRTRHWTDSRGLWPQVGTCSVLRESIHSTQSAAIL